MIKTTYFSGLYEEVNTVVGNTTTTKKINYITGIDGLTAVFIEETGQTDKMYYVAKDHLSSITHLINSDGTLAAEYSYDPCSVKHGFCECSETKAIVERIPNGEALREGRRRKSSDWTDYAVSPFSIINRGYTGHEHLEFFGLINMNGRIYDPISARFTTPDPFVQNPAFSQDFNRYSYVNNNPMRYTDPSGYMAQGCGYNPNWRGVSNQIAQDQAFSNNQFDKIYGRGIYSMGGGFGGATGYFSFNGSLLGSGPANGGIIGMNQITEAGKEFIEENFGVTPEIQGGVLGYWARGFRVESVPAYSSQEVANVAFNINSISCTVIILKFVPFSALGNGGNSENVERGSNGTAYIAGALGVASETMFSKIFNTWMGKDFIIRSQDWGGNGITGGKYKFAGKASKVFKIGGWVMGAYGMYSTNMEWQTNQISTGDMVIEQISNTIGFILAYGTAWGIGWNLGKDYGPSTWYGRNDYKWFE